MRLVLALAALLASACASPGAGSPQSTTSRLGGGPTPAVTSSAATGPASPPASATSASLGPALDPRALRLVEFPVGAGQGPHDVAPAADGGVWYTAQRTGELGYLDPKTGTTRMVKLDFGATAIVRFDPKTESFTSLPFAHPGADVRQLLGRPGEVWGAMSGQDKLVLVRTR